MDPNYWWFSPSFHSKELDSELPECQHSSTVGPAVGIPTGFDVSTRLVTLKLLSGVSTSAYPVLLLLMDRNYWWFCPSFQSKELDSELPECLHSSSVGTAVGIPTVGAVSTRLASHQLLSAVSTSTYSVLLLLMDQYSSRAAAVDGSELLEVQSHFPIKGDRF